MSRVNSCERNDSFSAWRFALEANLSRSQTARRGRLRGCSEPQETAGSARRPIFDGQKEAPGSLAAAPGDAGGQPSNAL
jgi:hypothetical protein